MLLGCHYGNYQRAVENVDPVLSKEVAVVVWSLSHVQLFITPWVAACQAPLAMRFPMNEYWSRLPFPSPGDLLDQGIELLSFALAGDSLLLRHKGSPSKEDLTTEIDLGFVPFLIFEE